MNQPKYTLLKTTALLAAGLAMAAPAHGQSADALLDKLVEKGILSVKEANDLREETDKDFNKAYSVKSGMPEWVTAFKLNGDFRGRFEGFYGENPAFVDRNRLRYRMRLGATASLFDNLEVGLRLSSSEASAGFGGDPISGNTTLTDNGSKKFVYIDMAYAKWSPINSPNWAASFTFGKMENPFVSPSTMVFDKDYTPEGFASQVGYAFNDKHGLKLIGGAFALDEESSTSKDPFLFMTQARWDAAWTPKVSTTIGAAILAISNQEQLSNANVPNVNRGNTRTAAGAPKYNFNPIYVDAGFTYLLDQAPLYTGAFPISFVGDYINNPAAPGSNIGYSVGFVLGKAGKRNTWELAYRWEELQSDAWFEEFPESDFGAFYQQQQPNAGFNTASNPKGAGYGAGTNVKGHWFKLSYSPYDSLTFSVAYFRTELINPSPAGSKSGMGRLQIDGIWKF